MNWLHKLLAVILLTFFLGVLFFSLFHVSMGMTMSGGMSDCPFMSHEDTFCPMNILDHLGAWKAAFLSAVPTLTWLLLIAGGARTLAVLAPHLWLSRRYLADSTLSGRFTRTDTFFYRFLQELFSSGVLHPKLF